MAARCGGTGGEARSGRGANFGTGTEDGLSNKARRRGGGLGAASATTVSVAPGEQIA
jgi:hypothetical protein